MKQPLDAVIAFHSSATRAARRLWIAGGGSTRRCAYVREHALADHVTFHGRISEDDKLALMRRASVLVATSVKGWSLIVTKPTAWRHPQSPTTSTACVGSRRAQLDPVAQPDALARLAAAGASAQRDAYDDWCRRAR
jgi:glycosyltransferase involved in cell wall biosynthesis